MILLEKEQIKRIIKLNSGKSYTYGLCKQNGDLFYVGMGKQNRVFKHEVEQKYKPSSNMHKLNIIAKEKNLLYVLFLVSENRDDCLKMEAEVIKSFGRVDIGTGMLTNLTDGGEAGPRGCKYSDERLRQQIERIHSYSDRISSTLKKRYESLTEEEKQKICNRLNGHRGNEKALLKLSIKAKERWADPEYKNRLSEKQKIVQKELSEIHRQNTKALWANPEFRERMLEARRVAREKKLADRITADSNVVNNSNEE